MTTAFICRIRSVARRFVTLALLFSGMVCAHAAERADSIVSVLRERAAGGDLEAMNYLGYLLLSGEEGVTPSPEEGLSLIVEAAGKGDVKAASNLGWLFLEGRYVKKDEEKGAKWIGIASAEGLPVAQSLLGDLYRDGRGVAPDSVRADSLYREAFERGLPDAGYKLYALNSDRYGGLTASEKVEEGRYYYLRGAPSEGVKLFYLAADEGDADAMALLGDAYSRAMGVPYDHDLSLSYFLKAALGGNAPAQFVIAELLEIFPDAISNLQFTIHNSQLKADAEYWYGKAAEAGVKDAEEAMRQLLSP